MTSPRLQIIIASVRQGRRGAAIGRWTLKQALAHGAFEVELVDLKEVALPLMDEPHHPRVRRYTHQHTKDWSSRIEAADAYVFVTPEYNHGLSAPLKNAIDYLHAEWLYKPVAFVSYGGLAGGTRATQMLKQVVLALQMIPAYEAVVIPKVSERLPENADRFDGDEPLRQAAVRMLTELSQLEAVTHSRRAAPKSNSEDGPLESRSGR